jgi:nicotinate phosphoribosyltransferase
MSALLTDLYEVTMALGYWKAGTAEREAVFHLFFRSLPFGGGYAVAAGLDDAITWLRGFKFLEEDLDYLAGLEGRNGKPLFERAFLDYLGNLEMQCDVDAMPEGTLVFPQEPLVRVQGPLLQAQLCESALLNFFNFQTLIATKAARICLAAQGDAVIEFGLRRAQGPNGAMSASRAAFIGGCAGTSNLQAGRQFGIPVRGTHAHSWVMSFDTELDAFEACALATPDDCFLLVDTYNTLDGIRRAVEVGRGLAARGHRLAGIRLDSGDLAWLSVEARRILDAGGFPDAIIVASNDLDEHVIESLKHQGARIDMWGVGTKLVTGGEQAALGGVYKLSALRGVDGTWRRKLKLSEETAKISVPGVQQVRRFEVGGQFVADAIYDLEAGTDDEREIIDPVDPNRRRRVPPNASQEDMLVPILRGRRLVCESPTLAQIRERTRTQLEKLHPTIKRLVNPHRYPAGLDARLWRSREQLIEEARRR